MSDGTIESLAELQTACQRDLGDPDLWHTPDGYPNSLALSIIDSIYSTGAHYSSVINVVGRYRDDRAKKGGNADTDGTAELLANIVEHNGPDSWASTVGNRRPTSTAAGAPLKVEAIREIATKLSGLGVSTSDEFRSAITANRLDELKSAWRSTAGQRSGITWEYALMLIGIPGVKADRMVVRYVARALGRASSDLLPAEAAGLVRRLANQNGWNLIHADHAIWRFESGRPVNREGDPIEPGQ